MRVLLAVAVVFSLNIGHAQDKDRKVIFELKTKCMELAKEFCKESGSNPAFTVAYYDIKHNRCFAICQIYDSTGIVTVLSDVHTGMPLAQTYKSYDPKPNSSWGWIGDKNVSYEKADAYIRKMTTESGN